MSFGLVFEGSSACLDWILGKLCLPHAAIPASIFTSLPMPGHQPNRPECLAPPCICSLRNNILPCITGWIINKSGNSDHQRVHIFLLLFFCQNRARSCDKSETPRKFLRSRHAGTKAKLLALALVN